ncbi:MAG: hypothetical protein HYZ28_24745 [Myxococcales bacterium]|nr:hypothetical protein [Myxococcales bacterium]
MGKAATAAAIAVLIGSSALADGGVVESLPDASLPDASVGEGGADRDNPEGEDSAGRTPAFCRSSKDCERGFACENNRCVFKGYRKAESQGCLIGAEALAVAGAAGLVLCLRRSSRR